LAVILGFITLCFVWGTSWVAIKYSLFVLPPFLGAAVRFVLAIVLLILFARIRKIRVSGNRDQWKLILLTGVLVYVLNYGLIYWAEQSLPAGITAVVFATFPAFTGVFSHFVFRIEPLRWNVYVGLMMGFLGIVVVFFQDLREAQLGAGVLLSVLAVLISSVSAAFSSVLVKQRLSGIHPVGLTLQTLIVGTIGLFCVSRLAGETATAVWIWEGVAAIIYLGVAASALAFVLFYWLLQRLSPVTLSLFVYFNPLVAITFGWLLLGETLETRALVGASIVLLGVAVAQSHHYLGAVSRRKA